MGQVEGVIPWVTVFLACTYSCYTDMKEYQIYDRVTIPVMMAGIVFHLTVGKGLLFALYGLIPGLIILLLAVATSKIGAGDGKLIMAVGAWLGWAPVAILMYFALIIVCIWAITMRLLNTKERKIPFGVCIFLGLFICRLVIFFMKE